MDAFSKVDAVGEADAADKIREAENRLREAAAATEAEHQMGLWQAVKLYPWGTFWSCLLSFAAVMDGFDGVILGLLFAYPAFKEQFGTLGNGGYEIPSAWQTGLADAGAIGQMIGIIFNGWCAERFGYKRTFQGGLIWITGMIFLCFFAKDLGMLLAGQILCGVGWGVMQTLVISYAADVAPLSLRAILTSWIAMCSGIGQLVGYGCLRGLLGMTGQWGWRIPFAIQWFWPIPLLAAAFLCPESPWWLVRKGRLNDARNSILALTSRNSGVEFSVDNLVSLMVETNRLERAQREGTSYWDVFHGVNLRRTEITCCVFVCQQFCGVSMLASLAYFLESAGMPTTYSFDLSVADFGIAIICNLITWVMFGRGVGRRTLYFWGTVIEFVLLIVTGGISMIPKRSASWAVGALLLVWNIVFQISNNPVCYALLGELPSRRLVLKTINLARVSYKISGLVIGSFNPYMMNPQAWDWGGKTAFFWAGLCFICMIWIYFRLPETKGLTYREIDTLFDRRVPARQFYSAGLELIEEERDRDLSVDAQGAVIRDKELARHPNDKADVVYLENI